jgi:predicted dehydrogenase
MKFGLIGCGEIGQVRAQALSRASGLQLVAVNDLDRERAEEVAASYSCAVDIHWQELVSREEVQAVIVSTPPSLHARMCIEALEAGNHVLCEKPLARNPEESQAIIAAAERSGKFLSTGFNYRFYPSFLKARELLDSGLIGELDHIRSYAGYTAADHNHDWLHDPHIVGGGALWDNGIHLIDLTNYFLGGVEEVKGFSSENVWKFPGCEDNGFALLRSPEGKIATLQASWTEWTGYKFKVEIYGSRGSIQASCFPMQTQVTWADATGGKTRRKSFFFPKTFLMEHLRSYHWVVMQSFVDEFTAFAQAVEGKPTPLATGYDGLRAIEIAHAAVHPAPEHLAVLSN